MLSVLLFVPLAILGLLLSQDDPGLSPGAIQILTLFAAALPVVNRFLVEFLRELFPSIGDAAGELVSRWVGVLLFAGFAAFGMTIDPGILLPAMPADADPFSWLAYVAALLTAALSGVAYVVNGSRWVHKFLKPPTA